MTSGNVLAFDPVDRVDAFAGAARIHADAADVASTFQQAECVGVGGRGNHRRRREHAKKAAPRDAVEARLSVILTPVPVLSLTAVAQLSVPLHPQVHRSLLHKSNRSPSADCPPGGQHNPNRQIFAERREIPRSVAGCASILATICCQSGHNLAARMRGFAVCEWTVRAICGEKMAGRAVKSLRSRA